MEIVEKLPNEIANLVYSFVGEHPIAEMYYREKNNILEDNWYGLTHDQIPPIILSNKTKRLRHNTASYKACLIVNNVIEAYKFRLWKDETEEEDMAFKSWYFSVPTKTIKRWCVKAYSYQCLDFR